VVLGDEMLWECCAEHGYLDAGEDARGYVVTEEMKVFKLRLALEWHYASRS
jgi:hypothetical protein